jgi:hypothetical protein
MKVIKVRSPFIITIAETGQIGSKIELSIYNKGNSIPTILSGVTITGTAGQFSSTAATFATGDTVTISGTLGGTGTITGYTSPKTYYVIATNGTTTFTLSETLGGTAITTTAGTPTGLTYITEISGFYSLSKSIPSASQISTFYNVSNYVKEFIENIKPTTTASPAIEDNTNWVLCKLKRYKLVGSTYTLLDTIDYVCVDGFTIYLEGKQNAIDTEHYTLKNTVQKLQFYNTNIPYVNLLLNRNTTYNYVVRYYNAAGSYFFGYVIISAGSAELFNYKIPLVYQDSVRAQINLESAGNIIFSTLYNFTTDKIEECKYTPVECTFINRYGGWEFLTFFKQQTNTIAVKGTDYKLTQSEINYNIAIGQFKTFNTNGKQIVKLNTGFVDENYSELITDLLLSETVLLDGKPVTVKTQGIDLKTSLKDRLINYEMDFEYAFNLINDAV